ncbi:hypothetical protein Droror1_Dr00008436 [Drosera rotundifolia]
MKTTNIKEDQSKISKIKSHSPTCRNSSQRSRTKYEDKNATKSRIYIEADFPHQDLSKITRERTKNKISNRRRQHRGIIKGRVDWWGTKTRATRGELDFG